MMKKILPSLLMGFALVVGTRSNAQLNYTVSFPTATYTNVTGTSPTFDWAFPPSVAIAQGYSKSDEGVANNVALPFTFNFNGVPYNAVHISSNGFLALGAPLDTSDVYYSNSLSAGPVNSAASGVAVRPIIAPLWDDLDEQATTNIIYTTQGTAPNRVFIVQWSNALWTWQATSASVSFQVKLYEGTNVIRFHYRPINAGTVSTGASASVGLADGPTGSGNYLGISTLKTTATTTSTGTVDTIKTKPTANLVIDFTPIPTPAIDASLKLVSAPTLATCISTPQTFKYQVRNTGTSPIAAGAATVNLTLTGANPAVFAASNSKTLAFNESDTVSISNINLSNPGTTATVAIVALSSDSKTTNDTAKYNYNTASTLSSFAVVDSGNLAAFNWLNTFFGSNRWSYRTTSYLNSALGDSIKAYDGTTFYMFNPVSIAALSNGILYTQCLALPAGMPADNYYCTFYMSHDSSRPDAAGFGNDSLFISVSNDNGTTWTRLAGFDRIRAGFDLPDYAKDSVNLAAYAGQTIHLGLEGVGNYGNAFAVDAITINANYPLPVKFTSFTGSRQGEKNILEWQTTNEVNNKAFELQRSVNGKEFSTIATIESKAQNGNSSTPLNYLYADDKASATTNYYRLRQLDKDGKATLSNVVVIKALPATKAVISRVYPNPVQDKLNIALYTSASEKVTINITDLTGKVVTSRIFESVQGDNNIQFATSNLAKGTYLIKVNAGNNELATQKFVKQ